MHAARPVAIIRPASLLGFAEDGSFASVLGAHGRVSVQPDCNSIVEELAAAGCLLPGTVESVLNVSALLKDDRLSRTASYLSSLVQTCDGLVTAMHRIREASVSVVGCGGIGSLAALLVAGAGIGQLRLMDGDVVARSNLNRQFAYSLTDVGHPKVDVLASFIHGRFPDVVVRSSPVHATLATLERHLSVTSCTILSADEPIGLAKAMRSINMRPWPLVLVAGYSFNIAFVEVLRPEPEATSELVWRRMPDSIMPSYGPANAEIAGVLTSVALAEIALLSSVRRQSSFASWSTAMFPRTFTVDGNC